MSAHRMVIEAGPGSVRRLCCGVGESADNATTALDVLDDPVALVDGEPVTVAALWASVLRSLACPDRRPGAGSVVVIHPSWWSASRVDLVATAAHALADEVIIRSRASLLTCAAPDGEAAVVVEIAGRLVALTTTQTVAEPRIGSPRQVAELAARRVASLTSGTAATVLIDGPSGIGGAAPLAEMIAERLPAVLAHASVELIDETRLATAAARARSGPGPQSATVMPRHRLRRVPALLASIALLAGAALGVETRIRHDTPVAEGVPPTYLVEGRVALQVPADWEVRRVTGGPGSARVEVSSPSDPQLVLHVTQSVVPGGTLSATADSLRRALEGEDAARSGVFVDFNPSGRTAGRPAVTYREVRDRHHVDWTVLMDGVVRISIGCQSRSDDADAVSEVCEQAVRSARAVS